MKIYFVVDSKSIKYFSNIHNIDKTDANLLQDSKETRKIIKNLRKNHSKAINTLFNGFFNNKFLEGEKIYVKTFPSYFDLGAVNIKDRIILLGQKQRSKYFYLGLLVHELGHIYVYEKSKNKLINEIVSMLLESYIYDVLEDKKMNNIRIKKELDGFHQIAMKYTLKFYKEFKDTIKKGESLYSFLSFLKKGILIKDINIEPPKGLLANLDIKEKYYLASGCLVRKEHFGTLILLSYGKRFSVDNYFFNIIKQLNGKVLDEIIKETKGSKKRIKEFVADCKEKGIICLEKPNILPRIVENEYISDDCLSFPRTVYIESTRKCNFNCIHCYSSSGMKNKSEIQLPIIKKIIDQMVQYGGEFLNIGGGEPLLYTHIYDTISYAKEKNIPVEITTNGSLLSDTTIRKLKEAGLKFVQVSIDGSTQDSYGKMRPGGQLKNIKKNIKKLVEADFVVSICTVVTKINYTDVFDIIGMCKDLGVNYYRVLPCMQVGRGQEIENLKLTNQEIQNLYKKITALSKDELQGVQISFNENLIIPNKKNITWMPENHYGCSAGRSTCGIDAYGNLYPCSYMLFEELSCGNIYTESIIDVWRESPVMKKIRIIDHIDGKCGKCEFLSLCRGGCRAAAYSKYGSLDAEDPLCSIKENIL